MYFFCCPLDESARTPHTQTSGWEAKRQQSCWKNTIKCHNNFRSLFHYFFSLFTRGNRPPKRIHHTDNNSFVCIQRSFGCRLFSYKTSQTNTKRPEHIFAFSSNKNKQTKKLSMDYARALFMPTLLQISI